VNTSHRGQAPRVARADADIEAAADRCFGEIAIALVDLIEERPEARELLRGRTFTRTLQ